MGKRKGKIIFSILLLVSSLLLSQNLTNRMRVPIHFKFQSGIGYDSNFLKLSDEEQSEIDYYPALLGDSESFSSKIQKNSAEVRYSPYLIGGHETRFRFKVNYNNYFESSKKSFSSYAIYFAQHLGKYEWVKLSYSFLPNYYLRDYRDRDDLIINELPDNYLTACYFSQGSTTIKYSKWLNIKRTWIEGILNFKTQYYNPEFKEFDLNLYSVGMQIHSSFIKNYILKLSGTKTFAENISNKDGFYSTLENDRGYRQNHLSFSIMKKLQLEFLNKLGFVYFMGIRNYSSTHLTDDLHNDRTHRDNKVRILMEGVINNDLNYSLNISNRIRNTNAKADWVEELKGFEKWEMYLLLSYSFTSDILY